MLLSPTAMAGTNILPLPARPPLAVIFFTRKDTLGGNGAEPVPVMFRFFSAETGPVEVIRVPSTPRHDHPGGICGAAPGPPETSAASDQSSTASCSVTSAAALKPQVTMKSFGYVFSLHRSFICPNPTGISTPIVVLHHSCRPIRVS